MRGLTIIDVLVSVVAWSLLLGTADSPASEPSTEQSVAVAQPSPQSVYQTFVLAVKNGDFGRARANLEPVPDPLAPLTDSEMQMLHELERLKKAMIDRFGAAAVAELAMGFASDATLATAGSEVDGETAKITLVAPDTGHRETTDIRMLHVKGHWRLRWTNLSSPVQSSQEVDELLGLSGDQVKERVKQYERATRAVTEVARRLQKGEYQDAQQVQDAVIRIWIALRSTN